MAAKPSTLPRWAGVSGDIVVPNSGKQDVGWVDDEEPANEFFNWMQDLNYQWCNYLKDGVLTGGGSMAGGFAVTGGLTADTFSVTGADMKHGERVMRLPINWIDGDWGGDVTVPNSALTGAVGTSAIYYAKGQGTYAGGNEFAIDIPIIDGDRLKKVELRVLDNTGGANISLGVYKQSIASGAAPGSMTQLGSTQSSSDVATNLQNLSVSGLTEVVATDYVYRALVSVGHVNIKFYGAFATYDRV